MRMKLTRGVKTVLVLGIALLLMTSVSVGTIAGATADGSEEAAQSSIYSVNKSDSETNSTSIYEVNENGESSFTSTDQYAPDKRADRMNNRTSGNFSTMARSVKDLSTGQVGTERIELFTRMSYSFSAGVKAIFNADGYTESVWYGSSPETPNKITQTTTVGVDGVQISVSYPPAFNPSDGYSVSITQTAKNQGLTAHSYSDYQAQSYVAIYRGYQRDSTTFKFRTGSYTLFTDATANFL